MFRLLLTVFLFVEFPKDVDCWPIPEASKDVRPSWLSRVLKNMKSYAETLEELLTDTHAVVQGDIVLSNDRNAVRSKWPTVEIPYVISSDLARRTDDVLSAMAMISEHTCVSFHRRTSEANYLRFSPSKGCASYVGFISGEQSLFVGPLCIVGNIVHEILHALGFHHEHTRKDRTQHIKILSHNIMKGKEKNFAMQDGETFGLSYDTKSIMHYGSGYFSVNGLPTIVPLVEVDNMGQRVKMTEADIQRVRRLYNCDGTYKEPVKESSDAKKEEDANLHILFHDVESSLATTRKSHVSAILSDEDHTSTTASRSSLLHPLNTTTRGQSYTTEEEL